MLKKLTSFFIPSSENLMPQALRRYKLIIGIVMITFLFDLNYAYTTVLTGMSIHATYILLFDAFFNLFILFALKRGLNLNVAMHLYAFLGMSAVVVSIIYSGGFESPVLPWLITTPVVTMLMGGRKAGIPWLIINIICVLLFSLLSKNHYIFPVDYNHEWENYLATNCQAGLILIIFFMALVFENSKNVAFKKLAENNILLSEEKKKTALKEISQEIHDNVGQTLSLIKLNLHHESSKNESKTIKQTLDLAARAIAELRNISHNLHHQNHAHFSLAESLKSELEVLSQTGNYLPNFKISGKIVSLDEKTESILQRVIKEGINNIIKHSQSKIIDMEIHYTDTHFILMIKDNGKGFDVDQPNTGRGLQNMKERIEILDGELKVISQLNKGTCLKATIPLSTNKKHTV